MKKKKKNILKITKFGVFTYSITSDHILFKDEL